jgi:hypothetical protein
LKLPDFAVRFAPVDEIPMFSRINNRAVLHDEDAIGPQNSRRPMGDHDQSSRAAKFIKPLKQPRRSGSIEGTRDLVDNQNPWPL